MLAQNPFHMHFYNDPCGGLHVVPFLLLLTALHSRGIALPEPAEILGNLDKKEDPDGAPCLRETDHAHADFLFQFAKTVIVCSTFNNSNSNMLLSEYYMANKCLEAY
jgi:hypothetical protein